MFSQKTVNTTRRIEQMQGDGVRHDLAHQVHDVVLKCVFQARVALQKSDPLRHGQLDHLRLGHTHNAVWRGGFQAPSGITGFHVALVRKPQNHFFGLLVGHHPLEDATQNKVLLHFVHTLVQQVVAFLAVHHHELRLQLCKSGIVQVFQNEVVPQLHAHHIFFRMMVHHCHRKITLLSQKLIAVNRDQAASSYDGQHPSGFMVSDFLASHQSI